MLGKRCWQETSTPFAQSDAAAATETGWKPWHNVGLLVLIAAVALVCWFSDVVLSWFGLPPEAITALWSIMMALLAVAIVLIGAASALLVPVPTSRSHARAIQHWGQIHAARVRFLPLGALLSS